MRMFGLWIFMVFDPGANVVGAFLHSLALVVQIQLQQNRTDLALKEVQAAKRWAQDSLLINLAESWTGMRVVCDALPPTKVSH